MEQNICFYIQKYKDQFNINSLSTNKHRSDLSLTIDTKEDFLFVKEFLQQMKLKKKNYEYKMDDIISFLKKKKKPLKNRLKKTININTDFAWEKVIN